jgi:integrase
MAHILVRKYPSGKIRYTANVRIMRAGITVIREAKTFSLKSAAEKWARSREVALEDPTALIRAQDGAPALSALIRWYIDTFKPIANWQRTKQSTLEFLERHPIGKANALQLTSALLIDHVRGRRASGAGPATAGNDLTWIGCVLDAAKSVKELPINAGIVGEARTACRALRLVGKSKRRDRRPTQNELDRLFEYFAHRDRRSTLPMCDILQFAIESARRESEITRIEWNDNDPSSRSGMVRDAKHPTHKEGNHRTFKYTPEAWAIVERQPKGSDYIFPYNSKSIQAAFTRACQVLDILDLHFHDMRHEATSRLFERGYQIHEVAQFTLHESWNELKRYTNLRPENVRELKAPSPTSTRFATAGITAEASRPSAAARQSNRRSQRRLPATEISGRRA